MGKKMYSTLMAGKAQFGGEVIPPASYRSDIITLSSVAGLLIELGGPLYEHAPGEGCEQDSGTGARCLGACMLMSVSVYTGTPSPGSIWN